MMAEEEEETMTEYLKKYVEEQRGHFEDTVNVKLRTLSEDCAAFGKLLYDVFGDASLGQQFGSRARESTEAESMELIRAAPALKNATRFVEEHYASPVECDKVAISVLRIVQRLFKRVQGTVNRFGLAVNQAISYVDLCAPEVSFGGDSDHTIRSTAVNQCFQRYANVDKDLSNLGNHVDSLLYFHHVKERITYNEAVRMSQIATAYEGFLRGLSILVLDLYLEVNNCLMLLVVNVDRMEMKRRSFLPRKRRANGTYHP